MVLLATLLGSSGDAFALLCELEVGDSQLMSSVAEAEPNSPELLLLPPTISGAVGQECNARLRNDCDMNSPGGVPEVPSRTTKVRPSAALGHEQGTLVTPPRQRAPYEDVFRGLQPGHYPGIYRPPRS